MVHVDEATANANRLPVFNKLASQLSASKLVDLAVIPVIFLVQTLVSYLCSVATSRAFGLKKRPRNFVIAMGVSRAAASLEDGKLTDLTLGLWQFKFTSNLTRTFPGKNDQRPTLGPGAWRQRQ